MIVWWCVYRENNRITFEPNTKLSIPDPNATNINEEKKLMLNNGFEGVVGCNCGGDN